MTDLLDRNDWERISHALAQFAHNPDFRMTLQKVQAILGAADDG